MAQSPGFISLEKAIEMTQRYRQNKNTVIASSHAGKDILANSDKFDRKVFETLLARPNCKAIRVYYGMREDLKICPIVVAVDANDLDILPASSAAEGDDIGDDTIRCPPICPPPSPLNEP